MDRRPRPFQAALPVLLAALIVLTLQPIRAAEATPFSSLVFVATDGDDSQDCATPATRCSTLQRALAQVAEGGEVRMAAGSYGGTTTIDRSAAIGGGYALPDFSLGGGPTLLDGRHEGTTVRVLGPAWVRLEQLAITGGLAGALDAKPGLGGGIYIRNADVVLDHVQVWGNIASLSNIGKGGGIYIAEGSLAAAYCTIAANIALRPLALAPASPGDTLPRDGSPTGAMPQGPILPSMAGSGGGIYATDARIMLESTLLSSNWAIKSAAGGSLDAMAAGGGLYAERSFVEAHATSFTANRALIGAGSGGSGGAIELRDSQAAIGGGQISDNRASSLPGTPGSGGGIAISGGDTSVTGVALRRNAALDDGGGAGAGILLRPLPNAPAASAALTLTNVLFSDQRGAALALLPAGTGGSARAAVRYATLISNTIGLQAGADQSIDVVDSIIVGSDIAAQALAGGSLALRYTDRYGNRLAVDGDVTIGPAGDLALPPGFAPPGSPTFQLGARSALLDQGTPVAGVDTDFEGQPRALDGDGDGVALPDLGWDERAGSVARLGPTQTLFAMPGQVLTTTMVLRNVGPVADTFQISIDAPAGWVASIRPRQVTLGPRGAAPLTIVIAVPASAPLNSQAVLTIRAQGQSSAATAQVVVDVGEP